MVALLVVVGAGTPALFLIPRHPSSLEVGAYGVIAAGVLFVIAGGLRLVAWKMAGRAAFGWFASAAVVFGVMVLVSDGLSSFGAPALPVMGPADQLVSNAVAGWLIWRGITDDEVNARLSPLVVLCWTTAVGLLAIGGLNAGQVNGLLPSWLTGRLSGIVFHLCAATVWVAVGSFGARAAWRGRHTLSQWGMGVVALLAIGCALRAFPTPRWAPTVGSATCVFAAACLAVSTAISRLEVILKSRDRSQRTLQLALTQSIHQATRDRQHLEELLHDIRNTVAGLQAADAVLRDGFDGGLHRQPELANAVTAELARLHALVDPARQLRVSDLSLSDAIQPVLAAERANGSDIRLRLEVTQVRADRGALARVLQNVLTNARLYAPGTPVTVHAVPVGDFVEISVHDGGPGLPLEEHATAFERGSRGTTSAGVSGNGLGLYVARALMAAMDGQMRIDAREPGGCCVVLSVRAALIGASEVSLTAAAWSRTRSDLRAAV
jgi:signal transduction histidine kinase